MADSAIAHNGFSMRSNVFLPNLTTISQVMPVTRGNMFFSSNHWDNNQSWRLRTAGLV